MELHWGESSSTSGLKNSWTSIGWGNYTPWNEQQFGTWKIGWASRKERRTCLPTIHDFFRCYDMGVSKNSGTPKSSMSIGFSIINHPFWGTPVFGKRKFQGGVTYFQSTQNCGGFIEEYAASSFRVEALKDDPQVIMETWIYNRWDKRVVRVVWGVRGWWIRQKLKIIRTKQRVGLLPKKQG